MPKVSVWTRERITRKYVRVDPKKTYPLNTIFCLRYGDVWRTLKPGTDVKLAFAIAHGKEAELTLAKFGKKPAPYIPADPTPTRQRLSDAIAAYLDDIARRKSQATYKGYAHTMRQFADSCRKTHLDEIVKDDLKQSQGPATLHS